MLFFVDESYKQSNHHNPKTTLAGVMVREEAMRSLDTDLFNLKKRFLKIEEPWEKELKGRKLLSRRDIESPRNREFVEELLSVCRLHGVVPFAVVQDGRATLVGQPDLLPWLYRGILWRADTYLRENYPERMAVVIFDRIDRETSKKIAISFNNFMFKHRWGQGYTNVMVTPLFANSEITPGLQIADVVAYCVNERYAGRRGDSDPCLEKFFKGFRDLTFNYQDPEDENRNLWGFAAIRPRPHDQGAPE